MTDEESASKLDDIRRSGAIRPLCSAIVFDSRAVNWPCTRNGQVECEGRWFCRQHDPIAREKRAEASVARLRAQHEKAEAADRALDLTLEATARECEANRVRAEAAEARADALQAERDRARAVLDAERTHRKHVFAKYMAEEARADAAERALREIANARPNHDAAATAFFRARLVARAALTAPPVPDSMSGGSTTCKRGTPGCTVMHWLASPTIPSECKRMASPPATAPIVVDNMEERVKLGHDMKAWEDRRLASPPVPEGCTYLGIVSRICERGTSGCEVKHGVAPPVVSQPPTTPPTAPEVPDGPA